MHIRKAKKQDRDLLVDFNQAMALETEGKHIDSEVLAAGVAGLLGNDQRGFYLVAQDGQDIVGSLMVTFEWSDWRNGTFWWIQSVYVRPENRRQGVYSALYDHVRSLADNTEGVCGYRLYVEKENQIAQQTYQALGMKETHYLMFESQ